MVECQVGSSKLASCCHRPSQLRLLAHGMPSPSAAVVARMLLPSPSRQARVLAENVSTVRAAAMLSVEVTDVVVAQGRRDQECQHVQRNRFPLSLKQLSTTRRRGIDISSGADSPLQFCPPRLGHKRPVYLNDAECTSPIIRTLRTNSKPQYGGERWRWAGRVLSLSSLTILRNCRAPLALPLRRVRPPGRRR